MSDQPKCDRCQTEPATGYDGTSRLCSGCDSKLQHESFAWNIKNNESDHPVVAFELVQVGQVWRKIFRGPRIVAGRLTDEIDERHVDLVKRTFYRLIDGVTGETARYRGNAITTNLQAILPRANNRMVVEEFEAWVAVKDGEL